MKRLPTRRHRLLSAAQAHAFERGGFLLGGIVGAYLVLKGLM